MLPLDKIFIATLIQGKQMRQLGVNEMTLP